MKQLFACALLVAVAGCYSSPEEVIPDPLPSEEEVRPLAEFIGRYSAETGQFTFEPVEAPSGRVPGYVALNGGTVSFATTQAVVGPATYNNGSSCASGRLCALVQVTNVSARTIDNVRVEISAVVGSVTVGNSNSLGTNYPSSAGNYGGWSYNSIASMGSGTAPWEFVYTGASFSVTAKVWGAYTRTTYTNASNTIAAAANVTAANYAWDDAAPAWRDACSQGYTPLISNTSAFTTATVTLPFPFTVYDTLIDTNSGAVLEVSSNGTISYYWLAGSFESGNGDITSAAGAQDYTYYVFWDILASNNGGTICAGLDMTTSPDGRRRYIVTWKGVNVAALTTTRLTFSAVFQEGTDRVWYLYNRWSTTATSCAAGTVSRGDSATFGVRGASSSQSTQISLNTAILGGHGGGCSDGSNPGYYFSLSASP